MSGCSSNFAVHRNTLLFVQLLDYFVLSDLFMASSQDLCIEAEVLG